MKNYALGKKLLALVLSVLLIAAVFPLAAAADANEFVSVNVLTGENSLVDLSNSTPVYHDKYLSENAFASGYGLSASTVSGLIDGDLNTECLFNGRGMTSRWWNGVRYALTESCFAEKITVYSGLPALVDCFDVYASDSLTTLYNADHWLGEFTCAGSAVDVPVNRDLQYFALIYNQIASNNESARPREVQLWTGDETAAFTPVCLTDPTLNKLADYSCVAVTPATMATSTRTLGNKSGVPMLEYFATNETNSHADVSQSGSTYTGFRYGFDNMYYIGDVVIDAGTWNADETWDVYASNSLATLYTEDSKVASVSCNYALGARVTLNTYATYIALVQTSGYSRIRALRIYTADATGVAMPFISENVLSTDLNEVVPVVQYVESGNVAYENVITEEKLAFFTDGDTITHKDLSDTLGWNPARKIGAQFTLNDPAYIGSILLYASLTNYPESYSVYASDSLDTLYAAESKVADAEATNGTTLNIEVNKTVQYIAFFCESSTGGPRFKEIEAWTAEALEVFVPVNVLRTSLASVSAKAQYAASYNDEELISAEKLSAFTDGDTTNHIDLNGTLDWNPSRKIGAEFALNAAAYIGEIKLYASIGDNYPESYSVYASDSLETLYAAENKLADAVSTTGSAIVVPTNKTVQYIAFFCDSYVGNPRFKEIEAWTAEEPVVFVTENALSTSRSSSAAIVQFVSNGNISEADVISAEKLAAFTDGNTTDHQDLNGTLDWDPPRKIGAKFALTEAKYIGTIKLYAALSAELAETYTVYASNSADLLYAPESRLINAQETTGGVIEIPVNKEVQYIAFICDSYTGNPRFKEIEAWTADPNAQPEEPAEPQEPERPEIPEAINDGVTRVLTIGNSFAENASIYASEIAKVNGQRLMFGYLKYPSCTLAQHLDAAVNETAMFKFRVTDENGTGTTIATGDGSDKYTIYQALAYTHWDVIVFQQESSNARNYATYSYLGDLIDYVKDYYPDAKLMFHQVWRWGEWQSDQFDLIKSASENAAADYGLPLIPSGFAFENAREALDSATVVNDNDGHYQHANTYGQFIAGCCYVGAIFDIQIDESTFASHIYVNDAGYTSQLVAAANKALLYYGGDLNGDGGLSALDLVLMKSSLMTTSDLSAAVLDANRDGTVDIRDIIHIKKAILATAEAVANVYTLKTQGNKLMLNGSEVSLQGVNVPQLSWSSYGDGSAVEGQSDADIAFETALSWGSKIIRLSIDPDVYMNGGTGNGGGQNTFRSSAEYREQIDGYIEAATSQGIPVVLDCHAYGGVTEDVVEFWEVAAEQYDDNDLVMFGLVNEPISDWTVFFEGGTAYQPVSIDNNGNISYNPITCIGFPTLISQIREISDNVLVIGGINWAGNLSGFISGTYAEEFAALSQTGNGIVLDIHAYDDKYKQSVENQIIAAAAIYPVLLGEYGPKTRSGVLTELNSDEIAYLETIYNLIEENGLSSTAWSIGAHPFLTDTQGNITVFGQSVKSFIEAH